MSLTVAGIKGELVAKLKARLTYAAMSTATDTTNTDLNGPIRRAVLWLGGATVDALVPADGDVAGFAGWQVERLLDVARLEALRMILSRIDVDSTIDFMMGQDQQRRSSIVAAILAEIKDLEAIILMPVGPDVPQLAVGSMTEPPGIPNDPFDPCRTRSRPGYWPYP